MKEFRSRPPVPGGGAVSVLVLIAALAAPLATRVSGAVAAPARGERENVVLVVHGGAGTIRRSNMDPATERAVRAALSEALRAGWRVLHDGGESIDAVEAAIRVLEDSPQFNAGRGAVFSSAGRNEFDASIMRGDTRAAGAVASVTGIRHPITAARRVMERTRHVLLVGEGAEAFAREQGLEFRPPEWFYTKRRWEALERARERERERELERRHDGNAPGGPRDASVAPGAGAHPGDHLGTVGAVALDVHGHIAAGTSTGGLTNKRWGRVGDSPIVGAGTWADDRTCGVSCTGVGEFFIRGALAARTAMLMELAGLDLTAAVRRVIHGDLVAMAGEGSGGMIALDARGHVAMEFNTEGMYRGTIREDGEPHVWLYRNDD